MHTETTSQSELIKRKHKAKMEMIASAISDFSRDTIAAAFVRLASDMLQSDEEIVKLIEQMELIDEEINK